MPRIVLVSALVVALGAPAGAGDLEWILAGQAADVGASAWARDRGAVELAPLHRDLARSVAVKAAFSGAALVACRHFRATGRPGLAKWTARVVGVVFVAIAAHNVVQGARSHQGGAR